MGAPLEAKGENDLVVSEDVGNAPKVRRAEEEVAGVCEPSLWQGAGQGSKGSIIRSPHAVILIFESRSSFGRASPRSMVSQKFKQDFDPC